MSCRQLLFAAALCAVAGRGELRAQTDVWDLPHRGAAEYTRITHASYVAPRDADRRTGIRRVLQDGEAAGHAWRYRQFRAGLGADGFETADYDDARWSAGRTPFGDRGQRTAWPAGERFLDARARFEIGRRTPQAAVLTIDHDDAAVVYLNGVEIYRRPKFSRDVTVALGDDALAAFVPGENVLAARVENTGGASYFDLGLTLCDRGFRDPAQALRLVREAVAAARRTQSGLFPGFRAPRFLCEGQLDDTHERLARPPIDLRDLPSFLAWDLARARLSGPLSGTAPRLYRFGDVAWSGRAEPPDATGLQRLTFELESGEARVRGDDKRFVERFVRAGSSYTHTFHGTLSIERRFDPDRAAITWFRTRLRGDLVSIRGADAGQEFELVLDEEWTLVRPRPNRDVEFRAAVLDAIQNGVKKLRAEIANLGKNVLKDQPRGNRTYNTGRLAIVLLALLHAEVPHDDPVLQKGLAELRRRRLVDTYSTANAIMALERYYAPRGELEELRAGTLAAPRQRQPSAEDKLLLEEWSRILLANLDTRVDRGYLLRFNYTAGARFDNSVNQYGLLGLYSAHLCGVEISVNVWESAANHLIDCQDRPEGRIKLELQTHRQLESAQRGGTTSSGPRTVRPAGWGYESTRSNGVPMPVYGSMTCAGISGLTICLAGLRDANVTRTALVAAAERAVAQGFGWLADNFTVHSNAARVHQPYYWVYYYLYGLERACELSGIAVINDRDWYYEGALALIDAQQKDGGWPDDHYPDEVMVRTAMAVLFLKQSSMPVYTQK